MGSGSSRLATLPYLLAGVAVIAVSLYVEARYAALAGPSRVVGIGLVILGLAAVFWSTLVARDAVLGEIEPRTDKLVQTGPFAWVRHPMYLGFTLALIGVAISARSWLGLLCVPVLFVPSAIFRARLEERALRKKFGDQWQKYADTVPFLLPGLHRSH